MIDQKHLKKENFARRFVDAFSNFFSFSGQEVVLVAFFAASLTFLSAFSLLGYEKIQSPSPTGLPIVIEHLGFPFESLRKTHTYHAAKMPAAPTSGNLVELIVEKIDTEADGLGLLANFVVYALPLIVIIKVFARIKEEIDYRRYDRT